MTYQILEWAENHLNTDAEFARFNIFHTSVIMCDENPRTGRKSLEVMLLLTKDLLAHPVVLVTHILNIALWLQSKGCYDDILLTCKSKGQFNYGHNISTRTMIEVNVFGRIPKIFDAEYVKSVIGKRVEEVQCFWPRYFDKERLEDFPELENLAHNDLHSRFRVPYRRGFNDDLRFDKNPQLEIPKTYEELERLFPEPFLTPPNRQSAGQPLLASF